MKTEAAHIVQSFDVGGIERLVADLIRAAKNGDYRYTVFCIDNKGRLAKDLERDGVEVVELNKKNGIDIGLVFRLASEFKKREIKVAHSHDPGPAFYGGLAAKLAGVPLTIYSKHGIELRPKATREMLEKISYMLQDIIIAVSEKAMRFMIEEEGAPEKKMLLIENGIDLSRFGSMPASRRDVLAKYRLPDTTNIIGTVARLDWVKDIPTLIKAFELLSGETGDASLVIVGDGPDRADLEKQTEQTGLKGKIFFLGTQMDIPELLSIFSVFVLSSVTESSPISLMEAMAAGLPIVATNAGGSDELVADSRNGFIVKPKDAAAMKEAVSKILRDKELAANMARDNRRCAFDKFGIENTLKKYEHLYGWRA